MANLTGKHQDKIPGMGGYVNAGPDLQPKQPTPYLYDAPCDVPHPDKHQSGVGVVVVIRHGSDGFIFFQLE